jgi:glycosyltransferase involved in cell wall biosynthesis
MMRVSVVIPTRNRAPVLGRALESVFNQSTALEQCLVVDDGSTDGTEALIRRSYPGVTYLRQDHRGVSAARNLGVRHTRSECVAFLDSDDSWRPDKLEKQLGLLKDTGYSICHSDEIWIRRGRRVNPMRKHRKRGGWIYRHCLPLCAISPSTSLVRTDVLAAAGGFDESLPACEDYDLWLRLCARYPVAFVNEPLVTRYAGHDDQLSARYWGMDRFRVAALEKMLAAPELSAGDRLSTLETLVDKLDILVSGARKRGNETVIDTYQPCLDRYRRRLNETVGASPHGDA